jgi:methylglutaconyl-CoA hydratase
MYETLQVAVDGPVLTVALNRPDVRNAFNARMIGELTTLFGDLRDRADVRVVVLAGNGKSFSAGADVHWMRDSLDFSREENVADAQRMSDMFHAINSLPKPVIGRVRGAALGGGMGLIAVCDVVVAAEGTIFGFTEAKLGIVPAVISGFVVPKIGESWARALFLTAERFHADVARQIGLVHWVVADDALDGFVRQKVADMLSSGPAAVREAKMLVENVLTSEPGNVRNMTTQVIARLRTSPEGQEGLRSFLEKRKPEWQDIG